MKHSGMVNVTGVVCNMQVSCLVDSGASHNFISENYCKRLGVNGRQAKNIMVKLADQS